MKKILISGFEPFGGNSINPSWQAVKALPDTICGYQLVKTEIPVTFGSAASKLLSLVEEISPSFIFMVGQAGGRPSVTPETTAFNERKGTDNDGVTFEGQSVIKGCPNSYCTDIDVQKIVSAMSDEGYNIAVSDNAGRYVCNDTFYLALHYCKGKNIACDFIHVPFLPIESEGGKYPSMELDEITKTLYEYIKRIIR